VEGSAPSERKEKLAHRIGARDIEALSNLGTFGQHRSVKDDDGDTIVPTGAILGSRLGQAALRREQLESSHCGN
jgi:hypothetical protein